MGRERLREALQRREPAEPGDGAVVPLVQVHAARLEQMAETLIHIDPEALARALRNAQALYGYDAVTLGASGSAVAAACHIAVGAAAPVTGLRLAAQPVAMPHLPTPEEVVAAPTLGVLREALRRLRPVLGPRAGTAVVLPTPARLAEQTGAPLDWAVGVLMEVVRFFGTEEPDLFLAVGPGSRSPLPAIAEFFGSAWVEAASTAGVVIVSGASLGVGAVEAIPPGWLFTTDDEIPAGADPRGVAEGLARLGCAGMPTSASCGPDE
ncbi:MAG: hypothetical protein QOI86_535 [Actinomycetota bacterium]|nr:hypothetical protein [Actinomycetota bacterium]